MQPHQPFRTALLALQGTQPDGAFASLLEVDRTHWLRIRRGARMTDRVVVAAIRRWPHLGPLYLAEIAARSTADQCSEKAERSA